MGTLPFGGLRVVQLGSGVPTAYCAKLFVDAGADVVLVEPPEGSPLRRWTLSGAPPTGDGALFGYLAAGTRSVPGPATDLLAAADLVLTDGDPRMLPVDASAVVVSVTPFGLDGPYVDAGVRANEFVLQALCGSIGSRGWPGEEPLQSGGRIGEWVAGCYAGVAAAAALRQRRRTGRGALVEVSVHEAMLVTMGGLTGVAVSVHGPGHAFGSRTLELPSIFPTADGLVGFCTITAQQLADFLVMIDRADLLDDAELFTYAGRVRRRGEFLRLVEAWTTARTTDEIIGTAVAFRVPVAPIGTPGGVTGIDHFRERGVFATGPAGVPHPRVPYRSGAFDVVPPAAAPTPATAVVDWSGTSPWPAAERRARLPGPEPREVNPPGVGDGRRVRSSGSGAREVNPLGAGGRRGVGAWGAGAADVASAGGVGRPLEGVRVTDLTAFWAGPAATRTLAALGADVIKVEGLRRPDGMRFSGARPPTSDRWWETGPLYLTNNADKRGVALELDTPQGRALALRLVGTSDLVIENFAPRVMANFDLEWDAVHAANPRAVLVRMPAFGLDGPWRDRVGFAQTMEQASGMVWMTGPADGPPLVPRGVCDPIAGLHAAFAAIAALEVRDATGVGSQVEATMVEAVLNIAAEAPLEAAAYGVEPHRDGNRGPGAAPQGVYRVRGEDEWVALAALDDAGRKGLAGLLGRDGARVDVEVGVVVVGGVPPTGSDGADHLDRVIAAWAADRTHGEAVAELRAAGVAAARVNRGADLLVDEHLAARGFWDPMERPVVGSYRVTGLPYRFHGAGGPRPGRPAPLLGQHNHEILGGLLGLTGPELDALAAAGVIGDRPAGL